MKGSEQSINHWLQGSIAAKEALVRDQSAEIIRLAQCMVDVLQGGHKLLLFGNGGSAADAQHMAAEFVNRFQIDRPPLAAIALTTDSSILTSIGNDFSFDDIFVKQIKALGKQGDLALGISTSGNSPNVLKALQTAGGMGLRTAALTGGTGGAVVKLADYILNVPSSSTPFIQECHLWVEHLLCHLVDEALFGKASQGAR